MPETTIDYEAIKRRIQREGSIILVPTLFGSAVRVTKQEACKLIDALRRDKKEVPPIEFDWINNNRWLVTFRVQR